MWPDGSETAVRQLLRAQPELTFFYKIYLAYNSGSVGDSAFHSLATDPQACEVTIQRLCAEQKAKFAAEVAEIKALPPEEEPYDPFLPDGCSVLLCIVLPDQEHYVPIHSQRWYNGGQTRRDAGVPDIFDVAYYREQVRRGAYNQNSVKS